MSESLSDIEETVASTDDGDSAATPGSGRRGGGLPPGSIIDRYVVVDRLGAGGMGVVYRAYDPELDRRVALKLLHAGGGRGSDIARTRLLREAQALAKLSHVNVVGVHDVGEHDGAVWLAMEFIDGDTLGDWMAATPRDWPTVVATLSAAGRGLAAAHAAGLLHRDFKPDNVMVARTGRVCVMDFGLARADDQSASADAPASDPVDAPRSHLDLALTRDGSILGTPAFMAPEQHLGLTADPRTDQFSFCVTLWTALYGERPFEGSTIAALALNVTEGNLRAPPRGASVPAWLRQLCERGLNADPGQRFASMESLLTALDSGQRTIRRRRVLAATSGVLALVLGVGGWQRFQRHERVVGCEARGAALASSWNEQRRGELGKVFEAAGPVGGRETFGHVQPWLDRFATSWSATTTATCLAHDVERTFSDDLAARADECLDARRAGFDALLDGYDTGETQVIRRAVSAAARLEHPEDCGDPTALARRPAIPLVARAAASGVRKKLAQASTTALAGHPEQAVALAEEALADAEFGASGAVVAQARLMLGTILDEAGEFERAETELTAAYLEGTEHLAPGVAADAANRLIHVVGYQRRKPAEGVVWSRAAEAAAVEVEPVPGLRAAGRLSNLGLTYDVAGRNEDAKAAHERALALREAALGADHPEVAISLNNLASVYSNMGKGPEALAMHQRVLKIRRTALGPDHPEVGSSLNNIAVAQYVSGDLDAAAVSLQSALDLWKTSLGDDHPVVATAMNNLASVYEETGRYPEAIAIHEQALAAREEALGPVHPDVASSLANLGNARLSAGEVDAASDLYDRALAIREEALGAEHSDVGTSLEQVGAVALRRGQLDRAATYFRRSLTVQRAAVGDEHELVAVSSNGLATALRQLGELDEAETLYRRALTIREKNFGPEHEWLADSWVGLAEIALSRGDAAAAIEPAERSVKLRASAPGADLAEAKFVLARALWDTAGGDRARAMTLAEAAADGLTAGSRPEAAAEARTWLEARR